MDTFWKLENLHCMEKAVDDGMLCCIMLSSWPKRVDDGAKQDNIGMLFYTISFLDFQYFLFHKRLLISCCSNCLNLLFNLQRS